MERDSQSIPAMHTRRSVLGLSVVALVSVWMRPARALELAAITIRNASNSTVGHVDSDGVVRSSSYSSSGRIEKDGTVRNSSNSTIGRIESDGTVRNSSNSTIGRVESDGTIRNSSNSTIGRIESDGTIRNSSNSTVGRVEGYSPSLRHLVAALLFFFGSTTGLALG